jgi:hypothetical protein
MRPFRFGFRLQISLYPYARTYNYSHEYYLFIYVNYKKNIYIICNIYLSFFVTIYMKIIISVT